jgi:hypothetical protein
MAYDKIKIFEQAKEMIVKHKLFFVEDIVSFLPCAKPTFYEFFPPDSNELNEIKDLLDSNRVAIKVSLRSKWHKSDNATLQVSLYKLICTEDERKKLSMTHNKTEHSGEIKTTDLSSMTTEELVERAKAIKKIDE